jgi:hypothetical protein
MLFLPALQVNLHQRWFKCHFISFFVPYLIINDEYKNFLFGIGAKVKHHTG